MAAVEDDADAIGAAILETEPPALSSVARGVSPPLQRVVNRCMAKAPDDRWQSVADLRHELNWIATSVGKSDDRAPVRAHRSSRQWIAWGAAALVAVAIAAVAGSAWRARHLSQPAMMRVSITLPNTVFVTFWYTWLFNHTGGSVFMTMLAHAADGLIGGKLLADGGFHGTAATRYEVLYSAGWLVVAVVLLVTDRRRWFTPVTDPALVEGSDTHTRAHGRRVAGAVVTVLLTTLVLGVGAVFLPVVVYLVFLVLFAMGFEKTF